MCICISHILAPHPQDEEQGQFLKEGNTKGSKKPSIRGRQRHFSSPECGVSKPLCAEAILFRVIGVADACHELWAPFPRSSFFPVCLVNRGPSSLVQWHSAPLTYLIGPGVGA